MSRATPSEPGRRAGDRSAEGDDGAGPPDRREQSRVRKFRQAAFVYLHVGILYEVVVWVLWQRGLLPGDRGPAWLFLLLGAGILALVFWGLWSWRNAWFARAIWALHSLRLPTLVEGAFFPSEEAVIPPGLYAAATFVVLVNLWMLARAGWDL